MGNKEDPRHAYQWEKDSEEGRPKMIARLWHGSTPVSKAREYRDYVCRTGVVDFLATHGNRGVLVLTRLNGEQGDFLVISLWDSYECIGQFAGQDIELARYYPEDTEFLVDLEPKVRHYEVALFGKLADLSQALGSAGWDA